MSNVSRRGFLKVSVVAGSGLIVGCMLPSKGSAAATSKSEAAKASIGAYVQIETDGQVTIMAPRPDTGQGVRTALPMIIAEELGVDWKTVKVVQAPANRNAFGNQSVGGSGSVRGSFSQFRIVGATARMMLCAAAAQKWGVDPASCTVENGVISSGNNKVGIGEVAESASKMPVPDKGSVKLKDASSFTIIGKPTKRVDNHDVVTGKAGFGLDARVPGMKHAVVARSVEFGGSVGSFDPTAAMKVPGVIKVFKIGSGVAVVAENTWAAIKGRDALVIEWKAGGNHDFSSETLAKEFDEAIGAFPAMPEGSQSIEAKYTLPYLSHAPMEPMNCTVSINGDHCEIWTPTQVPDSVQGGTSQQLGIPLENVMVNVTLAGGGFGRRLSTDYVQEAVAIAKEAGVPIQLLWTRDDDIRHDHYRCANFHAMKGAVGADGMPVAFYHQGFEAGGRSKKADPADWGGARLNYEVAKSGMQMGGLESPVPNGAWRSVENTYMNLVNECFFDELCALGKKDPVEVRMAMLKNPRLKATLAKAAELAGWGKAMPAGHGRGVACFSGYGSHITQIAEVEVSGDKIKVHRVVAVIDCGLAVNPLGVEAQVQGATCDGIATLLHSAIMIKNGGVVQGGLAEFGWARMGDAPTVEVHFIEGDKSPGGIGEVGFPASGPAVLNAIFAATGKRHRDLPILK